MSPHPSAATILEAVTHFLRSDVLPLLTGATAFNMRVTINAIDLVQRELQLRPTNDQAGLQLLRDLLSNDGGSLSDLEASLISRLSDGTLGFDDPKVASALRLLTIQQLEIDQPKYSACVAAKSD